MVSLPLSMSIIVLLAASPFHNWNVDLLAGGWGALYDEANAASSFQYFRFEPGEGALWVQSRRGEDPLHFQFPADGIVEDNGLVVLTAYPEDNFMVRFVVSAYRVSEYQDTGLATGYLYMFQRQDDGWMLFNSFPFRGRPLPPDDPIYSHDQMRRFVEN